MGIRLGPQAAARLNVPTRQGWRHVHLTGARLTRYAGLLERLGLTTWAKPLREAVDAAERITTDGSAARQRLEEKRSELVGAVASGSESVEGAAVALEDAARNEAAVPVANEVVRVARVTVVRKAARVLFDGESALLADLGAVVTKAAEKIQHDAVRAQGIATDSDAVRASASAREAWASMVAARRRIEVAWKVADLLRLDGLVHELPPPHPSAELWRYRSPGAFRATRSPDATWRLALAIEAGATPAVVTAEELAESFRAAS